MPDHQPVADGIGNPFSIRPFGNADLAFLPKVASRLYPGPTASPRDPEAFRAYFERLARGEVEVGGDEGTYVAVEADGSPLGLLVLTPDEDHFTKHGRAYVSILVVDAAAEGRGVGRALMAFAEQWARDRGLREVVLDVFAGNARAIGFYEHLGFRPDHVRMAKPL